MNKNYKRCVNCKYYLPGTWAFLNGKCEWSGQPILVKEAKTLCCGYWALKQ